MQQILLSTDQMRAAERDAFTRGTDSFALMRAAGQAVAACVAARYPARRVLVLAGPGNNGGDGWIAASALLAQGCMAEVALLGERAALKGDAARAAAEYSGKTVRFEQAALAGNPVIIDALFGTGLTRAIEDAAALMLTCIDETHMDVVAVDLPSGIHGDSGEVLGVAAHAAVTVTFACKKYGHVLLPGRLYCGEVVVADIGIRDEAIASAHSTVTENGPGLWLSQLPLPQPDGNKYQRGHVIVLGGAMEHAGAAKLAAMAALRSGAGLVSILCAEIDRAVYAASALSLMTGKLEEWQKRLEDKRVNTVLVGPGAGVCDATRRHVLQALKAKKHAVLDADAITSFAEMPESLFKAIASPVILTPHAGEFRRLFPDLKGSKLEMALAAAKQANAVVVLKGYDTVIAAPDGRASINSNAPATLATAGAGDVLGGICAGWLAQGMPAFEAACAAVWMHAEAARQHGPCLIAEDLPGALPKVLQMLKLSDKGRNHGCHTTGT